MLEMASTSLRKLIVSISSQSLFKEVMFVGKISHRGNIYAMKIGKYYKSKLLSFLPPSFSSLLPSFLLSLLPSFLLFFLFFLDNPSISELFWCSSHYKLWPNALQSMSAGDCLACGFWCFVYFVFLYQLLVIHAQIRTLPETQGDRSADLWSSMSLCSYSPLQ